MKQPDERLAKERVLKKIRAALLKKAEFKMDVDFESEVFVKEEGEPVEIFATNFTRNNGQFFFCYSTYHFLNQLLTLIEEKNWKNALCIEPELQKILQSCEMPLMMNLPEVKVADLSITGCEALISRTGSVVVNSRLNQSRTTTVFPPVHVAVAWQGQILYDLKDFFSGKPLSDYPSMTSIVSGPSRTADIEKTLVLGAHGPKELLVFYIDEPRALEMH